MGTSKELKEEFENWLRANNVAYFTKSQDGREYVVWSEHDNSRVREWLRARLPEAVYAATVGRPASSAGGRK
jgi:GTP-dependent phosphoenolpyruvate carboxykinase